MHAVMNGARSRSTLLTGAAGLLLLVTAIVMMVCAAPRMHGVRITSSRLASPRDQLAAWVWVSRDHWIRVTPAPAGGLIRGGHALTP